MGARRLGAVPACLCLALAVPRAAAAQAPAASLALGFAAAPGQVLFDDAPLHPDGRYILIRLAENRLYLMEHERAVWSAPVATGTGFRLEGTGRAWQFSTPRGVFRVQRKELDPVWIKPDWAFIEEGRPVPPLDSPLRREPGMLGTTALYIGYELALHGTSRPELVLRPDPDERRVSHGCIRLTNEDARTLYHLVEVGTPVLIY
ncbi:MAG TPA: L,D-transpeptidase [Longimicrobiales bacterium]